MLHRHPRPRELCLAALLLLGAALLPRLAVAGPLRTAAQPSIPMKYDLRNPRKPGVCVEVLRAVEAQDPSLRFIGWDQGQSTRRIEDMLGRQQLDVFCGLLKSEGRETRFNFIGPAIYRVQHRVAVRADDTVAIESLEDIRLLGDQGRIMVNMGSKYDEWLRAQGGLQIDSSSADTAANLRKLLARRGRFFYHSESVLRQGIKAEGLQDQVRVLPAAFMEEGMHFVVSKTLPRATVQKLETALDALAKRGDLQKIVAAYESANP